MSYVIKICSKELYHLYRKGESKEIPFREMLRVKKVNQYYPVERQFDDGWERVGGVNLYCLLLMPHDVNPVFASLQELRGEDYTWKDFCKARAAKIGKKEKKRTVR